MNIAGILDVKADGVRYSAKGSFTYNLGKPKREGIVGADDVHGYSEKPQIPYIEGAFTDQPDLDMEKLLLLKDATITLSLRNGKVIVLQKAWYAGDGNISTEEGEIEVRFEGTKADEVRS